MNEAVLAYHVGVVRVVENQMAIEMEHGLI